MPHALNQTLPLKQDAASQQKLAEIAENFSKDIQPALDRALAKSQLVHFARVLVIDNKYLLVLTTYDGDFKAYTEFFRKELGPVLKPLIALVDGFPSEGQLDQNSFFEFTKKFDLNSLGSATDGKGGGYLFSAYGHREAKDILAKL